MEYAANQRRSLRIIYIKQNERVLSFSRKKRILFRKVRWIFQNDSNSIESADILVRYSLATIEQKLIDENDWFLGFDLRFNIFVNLYGNLLLRVFLRDKETSISLVCAYREFFIISIIDRGCRIIHEFMHGSFVRLWIFNWTKCVVCRQGTIFAKATVHELPNLYIYFAFFHFNRNHSTRFYELVAIRIRDIY